MQVYEWFWGGLVFWHELNGFMKSESKLITEEHSALQSNCPK